MLLVLSACHSVSLDTDSKPGAVDTVDTSPADSGETADSVDTVDTVDTVETGDSGALEDYGSGDGPYAVLVTDNQIDGQDVTWFQPDTPGPWPVLIWSHGFARNKDYHVSAATRAATWGFLVVTPNLPNFSDHEANGEWLAEQVYPTAIAESGAEPEQVGFVGHSAGGTASMVAADMVLAGVVVGLDPVDVSDIGLDAAAGVDEPTLLLHGASSYCNSETNSAAWATAGELWQVDVTDATHCDFESDTDSICTWACGDVDGTRQALIQTYAVAWAVHHLVGGADDYMETGAQAAADRSAGLISW